MNSNPPDKVAKDEVTIPTLVGKTKDAAEAELKLLGLTLEVQSTETLYRTCGHHPKICSLKLVRS